MRLTAIVPKGPISKVQHAAVIQATRNLGFNIQRRAQRYPPTTRFKRTGTLGRGWTIEGPRIDGLDLVVFVGNAVRYARYVQGFSEDGPFTQRALFRRYGWTPIDTLAKEEIKKAQPSLERALTGFG